jgi:hypothetical protein
MPVTGKKKKNVVASEPLVYLHRRTGDLEYT